ncbi:MAG: FAD binding domain-containing protein [Acidobacteriia bacterium]|nr:FAD binding domain-containing protein [Terriglobia bacterium]
MSLPALHVVRPKTVDEAVRVLAQHGPQAMILAGGTDLLPNLQMRLYAPQVLVALKEISGLRGARAAKDGALRIGALTTLSELLAEPVVRQKYAVLAKAAATVAGPLQRNMATLGGNLCLETRCRWYNQSHFWRQSLGGCLKKDGTVCHVAPGGKRCWAVWSGDTAPALLALDAEIEIAGPAGERRIPLESLYRNDGMNRIALQAGEILTAVLLPAAKAGWRGVYNKLRLRNSIDYPLAGVAVAMDVDGGGVCRDVRVAISAVNPAPLLVHQAGETLIGKKYSRELIERVAHAAIQRGKPLTTSGSTPVYRREMLELYTRRGLEEVWGGRTHSADRND